MSGRQSRDRDTAAAGIYIREIGMEVIDGEGTNGLERWPIQEAAGGSGRWRDGRETIATAAAAVASRRVGGARGGRGDQKEPEITAEPRSRLP
jgi:hypothetical protein